MGLVAGTGEMLEGRVGRQSPIGQAEEGRLSNLLPFEPTRNAHPGDHFRFFGSVAEASTKSAQTLVRHTPRDLQKASIVLHPAPRRAGEELALRLGQPLRHAAPKRVVGPAVMSCARITPSRMSHRRSTEP